MRRVDNPDLRKRYRLELRQQFLSHRDPGYLLGYLIRCAMHYHHYTLAQEMARDRGSVVNSF